MLVVFAAILATVAFVVLIRLLWLSARPAKTSTLITLAAAGLIVGLAILAATGRLHWLAAVGAAMVPFLRRGFGLIRYLPWVRQLDQQSKASGGSGPNASSPGSGDMAPGQACDILGLGTHPTKDEVIAAHRRLIQKLHPDRGGSTFLAQQLNEAKRVLLKEL
jgi:DnaJ family protein C protein 19